MRAARSAVVALGLACAAAAAAAAQAAPPPPTDVAAEIADRRMTVSWTPAAGAASYTVSVRPGNGIVPLEWREFAAPASPYTIMGRLRALSGREYEVRVAAVGDGGESAPSPVVVAAAPELRRAPDGAISVERGYPPAVGAVTMASTRNMRPLGRRAWAWFACEPDGSDCKMLPPAATQPGRYVPGPGMRGKRLRIQVDYERFGEAWTAEADLGVVGPEDLRFAFRPPPLPECAKAESPGGGAFATHPDVETHLYILESRSAPVPWKAAEGGAIAPLCNDLIVATPRGEIASVSPSGRVERRIGAAPLNAGEMTAGRGARFPGDAQLFVADVLPRRRSGGGYELFVTHHYYTESCDRFRLSSTTVRREGGAIAVSPSWRTIFDAEPCFPFLSRHVGGRLAESGENSLFVAVGEHKTPEWVQDAGTDMGKLLRIDTGTGEAETLASGLRNPQGLALDEDGRLWWTEHGPQGGDELNLLRPGGNYGWPLATYGVGYDDAVIAAAPDATGMHDGFARPAFAWVPSIGVSALAVNDARWFPLWKDDLLVASLAGESIFRVRRDGADVQYVERIPLGFRIRDMAWMPDGRLALLDESGRAVFLRAARRCDVESRRLQPVYAIGCGPLGAAETL